MRLSSEENEAKNLSSPVRMSAGLMHRHLSNAGWTGQRMRLQINSSWQWVEGCFFILKEDFFQLYSLGWLLHARVGSYSVNGIGKRASCG